MTSKFLITTAVAESPPCQSTLDVLKCFCEHENAELIIIPVTFHQKGGRFNLIFEKGEISHLLRDYVIYKDIQLNNSLVIKSGLNIRPTAINPIAGLNNMAGKKSMIVGSPTMQVLHLPVPRGNYPKTIATTGAVTLPNYGSTPTGGKGAFYHMSGAKIIEVKGDSFSQRELCVKDGVAYDFDRCYLEDGSMTTGNNISGVVFGDTHWGQHCPKVHQHTFESGGLIDLVRPEAVVYHDLFSGQSINPHHGAIQKGAFKMTVEEELRGAIDYAISNTYDGCDIVIPNSNHNDFFNRWISNEKVSWMHMSKANADFYLDQARKLSNSRRVDNTGVVYHDAFVEYVNDMVGKMKGFYALGMDESYTIMDYEVGQHGHVGVSGSRGSPNQFVSAPNKTITGHCHSGQRRSGHMAVGTSTVLNMDYTKGLNRSTNTHALVYPNNTTSLTTMTKYGFKL